MSFDADLLVDRRRLKRRLTLWRFAAVILAVIALLVGVVQLSGDGGLSGFNRHIARITISGLISDNRKQQELFDKALASKSVEAIIVHINSPGGTTAGSEALYAAIRRAAAEKPTVAVLGTVAASGGYAAALACDHIVARGNTLTGSIGVIFQWAQVADLLKTVGVKVEELKSAPLKGEPSMFSEMPERARDVAQAMIRDSHEWFVGLVEERRPFDGARARELSDGRVYTGRQALEAQLIDAIGGERTALAWLRDVKEVDAALKVRDWTASSIEDLSWGSALTVWLLQSIGLGDLAQTLLATRKTLRTETLSLDGLISVWHPAQ